MSYKYVITIIIPVYNRADTIGRCIDSILCQDTCDIEIICIDDASTDDTKEILIEYANNNDNIRIYENDCNKGQGYSRNYGVDLSSGEYIWFVDSDDMIDKGALSELRKHLTGIDVVYFDSIRWDERGEIYRPLGTDEQLTPISGFEFVQRGFTTSSSCFQLFKRDFLIENNIEFRAGYYAEDWVHGIKSLILASKAIYLRKPLYIYIKHKNSISNNEQNVYAFKGLFMALCDLYEFCYSRDWDDLVHQMLIKEYIRLYRHVKYNYDVLHEKELDKWAVTLNRKQIKIYWFVKADLFGRKFTTKIPEEILERIQSAKAVYIFGTGDVAMEVLPIIDMLHKWVKAYIVSDKISIGKNAFYGVPVYHLSEIDDIGRDDLIIVAVLNRYKRDISGILNARGYSNYILIPTIR